MFGIYYQNNYNLVQYYSIRKFMNDEEYLKNIGKNIVKIRQSRDMKQIDLASRLDMEDSSLRRIEKGRVNSTILMLKRISDALGVELIQLLK
ncbi:MAG: helix-turn-helix transcriptional regulator [Bacteroidales bacterium]|jgi:ribosome-binding protein aMBF1 (putative translation factor)|nr:helix-turn-helix transcriptional regulator [Bacteroidales bacterium]